MRKKMLGVLCIIFLIIAGFTACGEAASIGIIGSSDGPTSVVVSDESKEGTQEVTPNAIDVTAPSISADQQGVDSKSKASEEPAKLYCTISISCMTILDNIDKLDASKKEILPEDGIILSPQKVEFFEGESVFDVLARVVKDHKIHMESIEVPIYKNRYIEGINNLYEFDCGELSGWMYKVNDWFPNYGSGKYFLEDGDEIKWLYTCDLGRDIGAEGITQRQ